MSLGLFFSMLCLLAQPIYAQDSFDFSSGNEITDSSDWEQSMIEDFGGFYLSFIGDFKGGFYGFGWESFSESGAFYNMSFHGSWGLQKPGSAQIRLGGGYGVAPVRFLAITGRINGMCGSYRGYNFYPETGRITKQTKFGGGILFAPGLRLRFGSVFLGANFDLGWAYFGKSAFYKDFELNLGFKF